MPGPGSDADVDEAETSRESTRVMIAEAKRDAAVKAKEQAEAQRDAAVKAKQEAEAQRDAAIKAKQEAEALVVQIPDAKPTTALRVRSSV